MNTSSRSRKPRPIGDLLSRYLRGAGLHDVEKARRLASAWRSAVSETVGRATRLLRVRDGVVYVGVSSSALLFELDGFRRHEILAKLREQPAGYVRDLRFELMSTNQSDSSQQDDRRP